MKFVSSILINNMGCFHIFPTLLFISIFCLSVVNSSPFQRIRPVVLATGATSSPDTSPNLPDMPSSSAILEPGLLQSTTPTSPSPSEKDSISSSLSEDNNGAAPESISVSVDGLNHVALPPESFLSSLTDMNRVSFPPSNADPPYANFGPIPDSPEEELPVSVSNKDLDGFATILSDIQSNRNTQRFDNVDPDIQKICNSTDHPHLCLSTVVPFLKGKADVLSVLEITMRAGKAVAKFALSMAKRMAHGPRTPDAIVSRLKPCLNSYDDILYNFQNAMDALHTRDIGTMTTMLSAVLTSVGDCEDELSGSDRPSPMLSYSEKLMNMTSNCLAIVDLLH